MVGLVAGATADLGRAGLADLLARGVRSVRRLFEKGEPSVVDATALDACADASLGQRQLLGPEPGGPLVRQGDGFVRPALDEPLSVSLDGFTRHAATRVPAGDPDTLERLCRTVARPAVAQDRLALLPDGRATPGATGRRASSPHRGCAAA